MSKRVGSNCTACPLQFNEYVSSVIPNDPSLILVIDQVAPRSILDNQPLGGDAYRVMEEVLNASGFKLNEVAQLSCVACRSFGKPPVEAIEACRGGLLHELTELADISVPTVALGVTASEQLTVIDWEHIATHAPMHVTYKPGLIYSFIQTFQSLEKPKIEIAWDKIQTYVVTSDNWDYFIAHLDTLKPGTPIAFDIETDNLNLWGNRSSPPALLLCIVITFELDRSFIIPSEILNQDRVYLLLEKLHSLTVIAHNGKFDQNGFGRNYPTPKIDHDTLLMSRVLKEVRGGHSLKELATLYLKAPDYESIIEGWFEAYGYTKENRKYSKLPKKLLYEYAAYDGVATLGLFHVLYPMVVADQVLTAYETNLQASAVLQRAEARGIKIDRKYLELVELRLQAELDQLTEQMWEIFTRAYKGSMVIGSPFYKNEKYLLPPTSEEVVNSCVFNPNSDTQMSWVLFYALELKHTKKLSYKSNKLSTNKESLDALPNHPFVIALRRYRRVSKFLSTYATALLEKLDPDNLIHINFNVQGTETGRLSADGGLHSIPRAEDIYGQMIQGAFIARPGKVFIKADYSQAELRVFAALSKEPLLINAYKNNEDVHLLGAQRFLTFDVQAIDPAYLTIKDLSEIENKEHKAKVKYLRQIAKQINFGGLVYLGGVHGILAMLHGFGIEISPNVLEKALAKAKAEMPIAMQWQMEQFRFARKNGYVQSRLGRKRHFPLISAANLDEVKKASVNAPIQGAASDLNTRAAYLVEFGDNPLTVIHLIHDSIICECDEDKAELGASILQQIMIAVAEQWFPEVPWQVDVDISKRFFDNPPMLKEFATQKTVWFEEILNQE
jgi:DNA polymerase I-like protein with 3'-5' exonuclease and polymerase domains